MKIQTFQPAEIRDENNTIIENGAYGKNTALVDSKNDGIIDYIFNNFRWLHKVVAGGSDGEGISTNAATVSGTTTTGDLSVTGTASLAAATVSGTTTTGDLSVTGTASLAAATVSGMTIAGETSVPTANVGNNSKTIANTAFVSAAVANIVGSAPETLNTLNELSTALGNDPNFATTVSTEIGKKEAKTDADTEYAAIRAEFKELIASSVATAKAEALLAAHPVGSYYFSDYSTSPADLFGGTWTALDPGRVLLSQGTYTDSNGSVTYTAGTTGGERLHQLTVGELPKIWGSIDLHSSATGTNIYGCNGSFSTTAKNNKYRDGGTVGTTATSNGNIVLSFGGGEYHNNLPPYVCVYCWKRTN
jgi:hypothetical protein